MDQLIQRTFTASRNLTYNYYISPSPTTTKSDPKPTLLFLHGWPDSSTLWHSIAPHFLSSNDDRRVLLIDLPGLGQSSKPSSPSSLYAIGHIAHDISLLLASEHISLTIPIGHDWGSNVATRLYLFHPHLCAGLVLLNVGYVPPALDPPPDHAPRTPRELNDVFEKTIGYRRFEYHEFLLADDAAAVCDANLESLWAAMHREGGAGEGMKALFCTPGALREYVSQGRRDGLKAYAREEVVKEGWMREMREGAGIGASLNWYRAIWEGHHAAAEKDLAGGTGVLGVPVLYLSADEDVLCPGEEIQTHVRAGLLPDLTTHEVHSGHWMPYEKPEAVVRLMNGWLQAKGL